MRLLVCTHAHSDHYGQAATVMEQAGCELWMHPNHEHMTRAVEDPEAALNRRLEVARQSGVPDEPLQAYAESARGRKYGVAGVVLPDVELHAGMTFDTDLGPWTVYETPGHAPSHVCLYQPDRRLLISGDHVLGRVSLFFDFGSTPDPAGEFLRSLDVVDDLDARLCLPGHGRTFTDVSGHIHANRQAISERFATILALVQEGPMTAFDMVPRLYGAQLTPMNANWWLTETLCYLTHLELTDRIARLPGDDGADRWSAA